MEQAVVDPEALLLVDEARASGARCALATNQHDVRRAWMRDTLRLDAHFDAVYYSCELGTVKPEPAFFGAWRAGARGREVGFVDDSHPNVEGARAVGLRAVRHDPASGAPALRAEVRALVTGESPPSARGRPAARG